MMSNQTKTQYKSTFDAYPSNTQLEKYQPDTTIYLPLEDGTYEPIQTKDEKFYQITGWVVVILTTLTVLALVVAGIANWFDGIANAPVVYTPQAPKATDESGSTLIAIGLAIGLVIVCYFIYQLAPGYAANRAASKITDVEIYSSSSSGRGDGKIIINNITNIYQNTRP